MKKMYFNFLKLDSITTFHQGGVSVKPCHPGHDLRWRRVTDGKHVCFKASVEIDAEGEMKVTPYRVREERKQKVLYSTEHCKITETKTGTILEKWKFDPSMTFDEIRRAREVEGMIIDFFFNLRKKNA